MPDARAVILSAARDFVRRAVPYVWGGASSTGVDCSGLVLLCYQAAGITIGRTTWDEVADCREISAAEAQPADLVIYDIVERQDHVGIVSAPGLMIDAPDVGLTVREEPIWTQYPHAYYRHPALDAPGPVATAALLVPGRIALVDADEGLRLRARPTTNSLLMTTLEDGHTVFVGPGKDVADGHSWRQVATVTANTLMVGWVADEFLKAS